MSPRVLNKRNVTGFDGERVYVGRPSKWGNPFIVGERCTREQAVSMYRDWFVNSPDSPIEDIGELKGKDLVCWCAPESCHADFLLETANA